MNRSYGIWIRRESAAAGADIASEDDAGLARGMRALAARMPREGWSRLRLEPACARRLDALSQAARRLASGGGEDEALSRLSREGRVLQACARQALAEGGQRLPACGGAPRVAVIAAALCGDGETPLSMARLMLALRAFDDAQPLTMSELWAFPQAMRVALSRALLRAAESTLARARQRAEAEAWIDRPRGRLRGRGPAFFEHAMKLSAERELSEARRRLERCLDRRGESQLRVVRQAHAWRAADQVRLDNLLAAKRLIERMDWQACFRELSQTEQELRCDPADVYGRMDDASRAAVQAQVAEIARRSNLPELTVARHAVNAARHGDGEGDPAAGTVCWWLADDRGRRALMERIGRPEIRLPRMIPDPKGHWCVAAIAGLAALVQAGFMAWVKNPWLWALGAPLSWTAANALAGKLYPWLFAPARILKLELDRVPDDCRALVTVPALLSSPARADEICDQLEALGCLEPDGNIEYLLLGDFADAPASEAAGDDGIVERVRGRIDAMNARAGRAKYAYLHRPRTLLEADGRWMGRDRKRGALMDLNRLLLGLEGAEAFFSVEGGACARLKGRFAYVVTLDADTRLMPGTVRRLVGAMAHPMNRPRAGRGFAVLQPQMETLPSACVNGFVRLFSGVGGVNTYPVSVSNLWQDVTGVGMFAGKGIYDVAAFHAALEGALPEGRVLSHDLIEGAIAGAGFLGDVSFYDGYPTTLSGCMRRLNRWTRGDWQLLPQLFRGRAYPNGKRLGVADRFRLADNLVRSLRAPALMGLLTGAMWTGDGNALLAALALCCLHPLLNLFDRDRLKWRRATAELAILPVTAWCMQDAVLRTLWRLAVSGRHLMDWVTAADAENRRDDVSLPGRVAAILLLPGLFVAGWAPGTLALAALFLVGSGWVGDMERECAPEPRRLSAHQAGVLCALARDTWRFFERYVPVGGCALPPDNVQLDPPVGAARRTSPTNVGLYLTSCLAACRLGFIRAEEMRDRMAAAVAAVERMEKWLGHLYNWHDIDDLSALRPRYVSSVDSGNLAAALLLCASASETGDALADRMRALARGMDFAALYDPEKHLFAIGMDAETGRLSQSHYDLLASESRILSFVAMMLGQVPVRHWQALGRACTPLEDGVALISWSGTMFEYLMPELFMRAPAEALLGQSVRAAVEAQRRLGERQNRPWGVSESGYYAFDARLNYQYRAFGLKALALGDADSGVVAPYAGVLAASVVPAAVAENVERMRALGWAGDCGLYEAADYLRCGADGAPALVKSHMAHHQGMALCALCNALTDDSLCADFMGQPEARALALLLEEKPMSGLRLRRMPAAEARVTAALAPTRSARTARPEAHLAETHLLYGGGATVVATADGATHYTRFGVDATRFAGDLLNRWDGACVHLRDARTGETVVLGGENSRISLDAGRVDAQAHLGAVEAEMTVCVSPEDGTLLRAVTLRNTGERSARLSVTDAVPVALAPAADWRAHAAFKNLFVESRRLGDEALLFSRRPREEGERCPRLAHMVCAPGEIHCETDGEKLLGREGASNRAGGVAVELSDAVGAALNPVSALQATFELASGGEARLHFALALLSDEESPEGWLKRRRDAGLPARTAQLAAARARAMLDFVGLKAGQHHLLQRMAALLLDGRLAAEAKASRRPAEGASREALWRLGLSGDRPILLLSATDTGQDCCVREAIRAHEFYRVAGLWTDLALLDDGCGGYARPVRDMLVRQIDASHLRDLRGVPGGVWLIDGEALDDSSRRALFRAASAVFTGERDFYAQARSLLAVLDAPERAAGRPMALGASTLPPERRALDNGWGGFLPDGGYAIDVAEGRATPAPWSDILADEDGGVLLTERAGGFIWHENSRNGRLTAFGNDTLREGWGMMLYLTHPAAGTRLRLLPGDRPDMPFRVRFDAASARYGFENRLLSGATEFCMRGVRPEVCAEICLENRGLPEGEYLLTGFVDWLMGADARDAAWLNPWSEGGACFVTGASGGVGYFAAADPGAQAGPGRAAFLGRGGIMAPEGLDAPVRSGGWTLRVPVRLKPGCPVRLRLAVGWAADIPSARTRVRAFQEDETSAPDAARALWRERLDRLTIDTPDEALNHMANGFLIQQALSGRILGRTGLYQPGGAWGFRDQLQDMLALLHFEPRRVRDHLLRCAARQFEAGDVLHWWHAPMLGVRTRISDDMLFLPWVTAAYVAHTEDAAVLEESVAYLADVEIPQDREDVFCEMRPGGASGSLHDHCMRAFRRASAMGEHGLALMGAGDWNDGMNRVGAKGRGESVWLSEFLAACADRYAGIAPDAEDAAWLRALADRMRAAIEACGWDGGWYLRAFADDGAALGSASNAECRIDAISQAWAVLAGLDGERCRLAMDAAWRMLADESLGVIRLLTPPFQDGGADPGYIRAYPAGVRENGAQYTHGALWLMLALVRMGDEKRAHVALRMLLPPCHADTSEKARRYGVEPYVMAADVYTAPEYAGRGGWTWYTGAASWMHTCILALLGYERRGNRVCLSALLGEWPEVAVTVRFGRSVYRLVCSRDAEAITLDGAPVAGGFIQMRDDGARHEARFPPRRAALPDAMRDEVAERQA